MYAATEKQTAFILRLATERGITTDVDGLSKAAASQVIEQLLAMPRARVERPAATAVAEPGMYRGPDGSPVKVQKAKDSDRLYAKKLVRIGGERLTETDEVVRFEFVYEKGLLYRLAETDRMTLEEAKAFGIRYGICCVCGAPLKDATSVANGIGPVCAGRV